MLRIGKAIDLVPSVDFVDRAAVLLPVDVGVKYGHKIEMLAADVFSRHGNLMRIVAVN